MKKTLIQRIEVGSGGTTQVEFTSIPQRYTALFLVVSAKSGYGGYAQDLSIRFNNVSTGYVSKRLYGTGSGVGSDSGGSDKISSALPISGTISATANTFGNGVAHIANYSSSNSKVISTDGVSENNATNAIQALNAGSWDNSAPITSIQLIDNSTLQQYSTFTLYGITAGSDGTTTVS